MYEKKSKLNSEQVNALRLLKDEVVMTNKHIRLGENGTDNMSVYNYSKWSTWNRSQKSQFKSYFPSESIEKSVIGWFLNLPPNTGFLDKMIAWRNQNHCGTVVAFALDDQQIYLNDQAITVESGEGIQFKLNVDHNIKPSGTDRNWACVMVMI